MPDSSSFAPPGDRSDGDDAFHEPKSPPEARPAADGDASTSPGERTRRRLLRPLGSLYAFAQTLTETEAGARRLVEATYERAAAASADEQRGGRRWLLRLLVETARKQPGAADEPPRAPAEEDSSSESQTPAGSPSEQPAREAAGDRHLRRRARRRFLHRALPAAFASLSPGRRLLLALCDIEQHSLPDAARVTSMDEDDVRRRLARARAELRRALEQMAAPPERALLNDSEDDRSDRGLTSALQRMAAHHLAAPPDALRPAARKALRHRPPPAEHTAPAPDRPATEDASTSVSWKRRLRRVLVALLLIGVAGTVGVLTSRFLERTPETRLPAFSAAQAGQVRPQFSTERPERAEQFVRKELGRRLEVPRIRGAALQGVGVVKVPSGASVPVLLFRDSASGQTIPTYVYNYALLNRSDGGLTLPTDLLRSLEQEGRPAQRTIGERRVLLWRHRDDIFAAVTSGPADSLRQRIAL